MRLAEEYDAAQERGEIGKHGGNRQVSNEETCKATEVLPPKDLHEARQMRDAEAADPGVIDRTVNDMVERGEEPTRAALRRAVADKPKAEPKRMDPVSSAVPRTSPSAAGVIFSPRSAFRWIDRSDFPACRQSPW